jgi:hypothetical protein
MLPLVACSRWMHHAERTVSWKVPVAAGCWLVHTSKSNDGHSGLAGDQKEALPGEGGGQHITKRTQALTCVYTCGTPGPRTSCLSTGHLCWCSPSQAARCCLLVTSNMQSMTLLPGRDHTCKSDVVGGDGHQGFCDRGAYQPASRQCAVAAGMLANAVPTAPQTIVAPSIESAAYG